MKNLLLFLAIAATLQIGRGQAYEIIRTTGVSELYNPLTIGVPDAEYILDTDDTSDFSEWQELPFSFEFYGLPVNGYVASRNGFISFTETAANADASANTVLPTIDGPNNAIYAFWDELYFSGTSGDISTWTWGTAPNRVHFIRWFSLRAAGSDRTIFFTIRLYECGEFDVVHSGGAPDTPFTGTVGCENADGSEASVVVGSPELSFPNLGVFDLVDDVVYTFYHANFDLALASINIPGRIAVGDHDVRGVLTNHGKEAITSFQLHYNVNGGPLETMNVNGVNIPPYGGTYTFIHDTPWTITENGELYELCIYADQLNGAHVDEKPCNDQGCKTIFANTGTSAPRAILIEEFSGAWCGHCPDGEAELEEILADYPEEVIAVAYHGGDAMDIDAGYEISDLLNVYFAPSAGINRVFSSTEGNIALGRDDWASSVAAQRGGYTPASVAVSHTYNPANHILRVTLTANFVDDAYGDMRFALVITENGITGTGTGYDQVNFYNNTPGHLFAGMGNPIVGYVHNRVARAMPGGPLGSAGVIPNLVNAGEEYSEEFIFVIPSSWEEENLSLVGLLAYHSSSLRDREIINAQEVKMIDGPTASTDAAEFSQMVKIFPNPMQEQLNLSFSSPQSTRVSIQVYSNEGRLVRDLGEREFPAGSHQMNYELSGLAAGMYQLVIRGEGHITTERFVVMP